MNGYIPIKEADCKRAIKYLEIFRGDKNAEGVETPNVDALISRLAEAYEEDRMMNKEETSEMVGWALEQVDN